MDTKAPSKIEEENNSGGENKCYRPKLLAPRTVKPFLFDIYPKDCIYYYVYGLYLLTLQFISDLHAVVSPNAPRTPLRLILFGKSKNALFSTFPILDQTVWLGRTSIYKRFRKYTEIPNTGNLVYTKVGTI
ncbi:hypothetical protein CASFOL_011912 [Castilleja foliolosa]|uniref:Uncharacterized protein n=1 Tax=Castilleja foliolosa TaxID=1961234 RepID=A0ABD3DNV4_9LAMI